MVGCFADICKGFYINLPIGAVTILILIFTLKVPPPQAASATMREKIAKFDSIGTIVFLPGTVCLLLALQWGGTTYAWDNGRIIALLVLAGVLIFTFMAVQAWKEESATVPPRIVKQRSVASAFQYSTCVGSSMLTMAYFLPVWFQAIQGVSAVESGIRVLPFVLSLVLGTVSSGAITFRVGYYTPTMIISSIISSIGAGLITTWQVDTSLAKCIGYQILYGFGLGLGMQQSNVGVQTVLPRKDVPIGVSLIFFGQTLGGAIFLSVAQNIFSNKLEQNFTSLGGLDIGAVTSTGATDIRSIVPPGMLEAVLTAYNNALRNAFYIALAMSCCSLVGALTMEWKSVKKGEGQGEKSKPPEKTADV